MIDLVQVVAPLPSAGSLLVGAAYALLVGLQGYQLKATALLKNEVLTFRVLLTGINGENGINGTQKEHTEKISGLERTTEKHEYRLDTMEDERRHFVRRAEDQNNA